LLAYPLSGQLGAWIGVPATFLVMAALAAISIVLAMRLWPAHDPAEIEHDHPEEEHAHAFGDALHHGPDVVGMPHPAPHRHEARRHSHVFVIDDHHPVWPSDK
jgi:hypothetical protein